MTRHSNSNRGDASPMPTAKWPSSRTDFEVAIICALGTESNAVEASVDEFWDESSGRRYGKAQDDSNSYSFGRIGRHNVVIAYMPGMGPSAAASVATSLRMSFSRIRLGLVVGVCGAVPQPSEDGERIFLGDVLISTGLVQHVFGRQYGDEVVRRDTLNDNLARPNAEIRSFLQRLQGFQAFDQLQRRSAMYIAEIGSKRRFLNWQRPPLSEDKLFRSIYPHKHHAPIMCAVCADCQTEGDTVCEDARESSCSTLRCDDRQVTQRSRRNLSDASNNTVGQFSVEAPDFHFGRLASGDQVMKSALHRDRIALREKVIGFEMEGAGVWDVFPTIVIKSACDYADGHKNKKWQKYAAIVAAASAKALLCEWSGSEEGRLVPLISRCVYIALKQHRTDDLEVYKGSETPAAITAPTEPMTFTFNNHAGVGSQIGTQTVHGSVYHGPVYSYSPAPGSDNYGVQMGFNFGSVTNNDYRQQ